MSKTKNETENDVRKGINNLFGKKTIDPLNEHIMQRISHIQEMLNTLNSKEGEPNGSDQELATQTNHQHVTQVYEQMAKHISQFFNNHSLTNVTEALWQLFYLAMSAEDADALSHLERANLAYDYKKTEELLTQLHTCHVILKEITTVKN